MKKPRYARQIAAMKVLAYPIFRRRDTHTNPRQEQLPVMKLSDTKRSDRVLHPCVVALAQEDVGPGGNRVQCGVMELVIKRVIFQFQTPRCSLTY